MKKVVLLFGVLVLLNLNLFSQFKQKDVELTASAGLGSMSISASSGIISISHSYSYMLLSVMPGYFVLDGLSIEPEIGMTAIESSRPDFLFLVNVSYTYLIPKTTIAPFGRIGYGVTNSIGSFPNQFLNDGNPSDMNISVFNIGAGIKHIIGRSAVLRLELNYRNFSQNVSSIDTKAGFVSLLFGFGIIL
jgi:hypothetical protein